MLAECCATLDSATAASCASALDQGANHEGADTACRSGLETFKSLGECIEVGTPELPESSGEIELEITGWFVDFDFDLDRNDRLLDIRFENKSERVLSVEAAAFSIETGNGRIFTLAKPLFAEVPCGGELRAGGVLACSLSVKPVPGDLTPVRLWYRAGGQEHVVPTGDARPFVRSPFEQGEIYGVEARDICRDGFDNNADGFTDCDDRACCAQRDDCPVESYCGLEVFRGPENTEAACSDGISNDGDAYVDCEDFDCCGIAGCTRCAP